MSCSQVVTPLNQIRGPNNTSTEHGIGMNIPSNQIYISQVSLLTSTLNFPYLNETKYFPENIIELIFPNLSIISFSIITYLVLSIQLCIMTILKLLAFYFFVGFRCGSFDIVNSDIRQLCVVGSQNETPHRFCIDKVRSDSRWNQFCSCKF